MGAESIMRFVLSYLHFITVRTSSQPSVHSSLQYLQRTKQMSCTHSV